MIILDLGSGNTCQNDFVVVERMISAIHSVDRKRNDVVLKWQLFKDAPPNVPLEREIFDYAYHYAKGFGYQTTASVFDRESLEFLQKYDVPFIKLACRPDLYFLGRFTDNQIILSSESPVRMKCHYQLACIKKYPATIEDYEAVFQPEQLKHVSDHTIGWELYHKYKPTIIEKHFVHERRDDNPDAGPFAVTAEDLLEIL